jgi:hypothetical protein
MTPEIAGDIETLIDAVRNKMITDKCADCESILEAADRIEAYLATYQPEEKHV